MPPSTPPPGPPSSSGGADCAHPERDANGICAACGHCAHEVILNGACYFCGSTDIDALALSPKPAADIVPASRLVRPTTRKRE